MKKTVLFLLLSLLLTNTANAEIKDNFELDPAKKTNELDLTPKYKVNEIVLQGAEGRQQVVNFVIMIKKGEFVTEKRIRQEIQDIYNLGYFKDDIDFKAERMGDGYKIIN